MEAAAGAGGFAGESRLTADQPLADVGVGMHIGGERGGCRRLQRVGAELLAEREQSGH